MRIETSFGEEFENFYNEYAATVNGKKMMEIEGVDRRALDVAQMSHQYFTENLPDVTIDANANMNEGISPNNYGTEIVRGIQKLEGFYLMHRYAVRRYGLDRANKLIRSVLDGTVYLHDASGVSVQQPYCYAASTSMLMVEGRNYGQLHSVPAKHAHSFVAQCIEFVMDCSQLFAGAVALSDLVVNYAYFAKKENLSDKEIENDLQGFVHVVNNAFRVGGQSPFTNISIFDMPNLTKVFKLHVYPDGSSPDFDYIMRVQRIFGEWFSRGDPSTHMPYRFPVVTLNICRKDDGTIPDQEFLDWVSRVNIGTGCFNIYVNNGSRIASCCRLTSDTERMRQFRADSFGNGGNNIGSHRVVTINLPRIALKSAGKIDEFYMELDHALDMTRDLLRVHREDILRKRIDGGFLRFFKPLGWFSINHLFSTIGIIGIPEMNFFMGHDIRKEDGQRFTLDVLNFVEEYAKRVSIELGYAFNVEEIPGETVAVKLAVKDKILFDKVPFLLYSNQYVSLMDDIPMPERINISGKFQELTSGGGILHINVKERIVDPGIMKKLIEYSVSKGAGHLAVNYGFGTCINGHTTVCGNSMSCSICGFGIESYFTRVVGYFTKITSWNKVRREFEFKNRKFERV